MHDLTIAAFSRINRTRCERWHPGFPDDQWTGADWSNAAAGEVGEAANIVKKLRRLETGTGSAADPGVDTLRRRLGDEIADAVTYLDLLAQHYGLDLAAALVRKFNAVSEREGMPERISRNTRYPFWPDMTDEQGEATMAWQNTTCGDCVEGRCHWGGDDSDAGAAAVAAGRPAPRDGECGCNRHPASVYARRFGTPGRPWVDDVVAWWEDVRALPDGRPGWLGPDQPYPCGCCGTEVDSNEMHVCHPTGIDAVTAEIAEIAAAHAALAATVDPAVAEMISDADVEDRLRKTLRDEGYTQ